MKKILVVEDESFLANALYDKLTREGYDVALAENGQVGLEKALSWEPDCVLLDIVMPVKDGMSMLRDLRRTTTGAKLPVILLTNLSDPDTATKAMENGVTDYLVKSDWSLEDVITKIEQITSDK